MRTFKDFITTKSYNTSLTGVGRMISSNMAKQHVDTRQPTSANYVTSIDYYKHDSDPTKDIYHVRVSNNKQPVVDKRLTPAEFINRFIRMHGQEPKQYASIIHDPFSPDKVKISTWGEK